jgi:ubiquitin-activating enzyme E1
MLLSLCLVLAGERSLGSVLDEELYSRQLYVMGKSAMLRMAESDVLVIGLSGLGAEAAKNLVLAGVRSVVVHDPKPVKLADLSSHWCLNEHSLGKSRAEESVSRLMELNPYVKVSQWSGSSEIGPDDLRKFRAVLCVDQDVGMQLRLNEAARQTGCRFISASSRGAFASVFCDFGPEHVTYDVNGEEPKSSPVVKHEGGVIKVAEGETHIFQPGDVVRFEDGGPEHSVLEVMNRTTFIVDPTPSQPITRAVEVKLPRTDSFITLEDALSRSGGIGPLLAASADMTRRDRNRAITSHLCFLTLDAWRRKHGGAFPVPGCRKDAAEFLRLLRQCPASEEIGSSLDEKLVRAFSSTAAGSLVGMSSAVGGIAAQEVLKACVGVFAPLHQFLYFDCMESIPSPLPSARDCAARGDRYDGQRAVIGDSGQKLLASKKVFVVGAGAIGCELLKCLALMGVGKVVVTDMDTIEKSNLNRQFLFRSSDVGKFKSEVAATAAQRLNPELSVKALTKKLEPETEDLFDDEFWNSSDAVLTALDNVAARLYVDKCCVRHRRPLLDSGTLGAKGNTQAVLPHYTESYGSSADPEQADIPLCTLKHFPFEVTHTIEWARDLFDGLFRLRPELAGKLTELKSEADIDASLHGLLEELRGQGAWGAWAALRDLRSDLGEDSPSCFGDCVAWAKQLFRELFYDGVTELLEQHPLDSLDEDGTPFWGGATTRRCPRPLSLQSGDVSHREFVWWAAFLRAEVYGIPVPRSLQGLTGGDVDELSRRPRISEKAPQQEVELALHNELEGMRQDLQRRLAGEGQRSFTIQPLLFEKDDDSNGHVDFVTAASNLRAANYGIPPATRLQTKRVAGKIVPAIATTTSVVAGLVSLETSKLALEKPPGDFRNAFVNLARPFIAFVEPAEAEPIADGSSFTLWDRIVVGGGRKLTPKGLEVFLREQVADLQCISTITSGDTLLYCDAFPTGSGDDGSASLASLAATAADDADDEGAEEEEEEEGMGAYLDLDVLAEDTKGKDLVLPPIRIMLDDDTRGTGEKPRQVLAAAKESIKKWLLDATPPE